MEQCYIYKCVRTCVCVCVCVSICMCVCVCVCAYLQIFREFLSSLVGRVHGEEDSKLHVHLDRVAVREHERLPLLLLARQHHCDLGKRGKGFTTENYTYSTVVGAEA
jgi:hypothetical protein